jgi:uncharacterized membrane protein (DUF4010 family)
VIDPRLTGLGTALGIGLLVGLVRERQTAGDATGPSAAGVRTHAIAALGAATAALLDLRVFVLVLGIAGLLVALSYRRTSATDVGLTGEFALLLTTLLGGLALGTPGLAAGIGVTTAGLLHLRTELHHLGRELITPQELHDGLVLLASAAVVLPLLETTPVDPWGVLVPAKLWLLVVLVMAAGVGGELAIRLVGARYGLPVAGFFAGFASSTAATLGYGARAKDAPRLVTHAASAALLANVATLLLLAAVLATANTDLFRAVALPLGAAGAVLVVAAGTGFVRDGAQDTDILDDVRPEAFKITAALALAAFVALLLVVSAVLSDWLGQRGALIAAVVAGTVELQGAALAIAQLAGSGRVSDTEARWGIVLLLATSGSVKSLLALSAGGRSYGSRVAFALASAVGAAALAAWVS